MEFLQDLKLQNKIFRANMKPIILLAVGDAQGNHKLAGMYGSLQKLIV